MDLFDTIAAVWLIVSVYSLAWLVRSCEHAPLED
jgi:hypothetical protein